MIEFSATPVNQKFHLEGVRHILPFDAFRMLESNKALAIDVRETGEVMSSSVDCPQLMLYALADIQLLTKELPAGTPVIVISSHGERSTQAAALLMNQGMTEVYNLDGGMHAWIEAGLPVAGDAGCSCGCH